MLRFEDLRVRDQQDLSSDFFNRRFRLIAETIGQLNADVSSVTGDTDRLVALGLNRVNEVLGPLLQKLQMVSEVGFLVAESATPVRLSLGLNTTFAISEALRELFSPTPYLFLQRKAAGSINDYAALRLIAYNRANGGLAVDVVHVSGDIGAGQYSDWVISVAAGVSTAMMEAMLGVASDLGTLSGIAAEAQAAIAQINSILATAGVASVNGKTGAVVLGLSDIPQLVSALASKADSNHGHSIAQIANLQATLNALGDGGAY